MESLSEISEYLNYLEEELRDDGDSSLTMLSKLEKTEEELELFEALPHKSLWQGAWDAELNLTYPDNYITDDMLSKLGFVRLDYMEYGKRVVRKVRVEIHGYNFLMDFMVIDYASNGEPSVVFGRNFLLETKCRIDFALGELRIDVTMLKEERDVEELLIFVVERESEESVNEEKLDEVLMGRARLEEKDFGEETKAMGVVKNVRVQIGYQAYLMDFLILDILIDKELSFLLGRPFLRTCEAIIDLGTSSLTIDDGVMRHTLGRDEDGNPKYGPLAPSYLNIEDDMERALAIEAHFNPFKNILVFKKMIDFLGSLPVQLKNRDWGSEGYSEYKKIDGDNAWHVKFEVTTPGGMKYTRKFKTKDIERKLSGKFTSEDILKFDHFLD
ncbi:putative ribonuclease H-like domain-containing protein [Tanacetum coccineum]|uniref:Ribonuclease H-like domain-containing protein n=1 Tax=Tanacetum coccineum TaxID=301880 RepID=A0ABQ4WSQ7_9ASTR